MRVTEQTFVYVTREFQGSGDDDPDVRVFTTLEKATDYAVSKGHKLTTLSQRFVRGSNGNGEEIDITKTSLD